jgi:hypothetical protein
MANGESVLLEADLYKKERRAKVRLSAYQTLGQRIFMVIVGLVVLMTAALIAWAFVTYPSLSDVAKLAPEGTGEQKLQLWREAKAEWVQQLISVGQMVLFGSFVPLLGTIAGYLLGERAGSQESTEEDLV